MRMVEMFHRFKRQNHARVLRQWFNRRHTFGIDIRIDPATMVQNQIPPEIGTLHRIRIGLIQLFQFGVMILNQPQEVIICPEFVIPVRI